ncbi:hypothetical protein [Prosthecobacter dejongeii]|uniref:Uncharacterized protein n=1 Tax=Prosthecobacter dejongeii TaxID=48465 RepID=A0A7W7YJ00_9BACT|nr:hypothetical protein [Prosthecobacter dejongeii]MBB5037135.1 hypothetical protein [Prosthecobacter dejongeii]
MSRATPIPFDPDQLGQVTQPKRHAQPAALALNEILTAKPMEPGKAPYTPFDPEPPSSKPYFDPASGTGPAPMLSEILAAMPMESGEAPHPDDLKGTAKPLDNDAKWKLSDLAKRTYDHLKNAGEIPAGESLENFRRRVSVGACGKRISQACHGDRKLIQAAFLALKGQAGQAARAVAKAATTALDIAKHTLWAKVHELQLPPAYAETLSRRFYKCDVAQIHSPKQVWSLMYTIINNANAASGKGSPNNRFKSAKAKRLASKQTKSL